MSAVLSYIFTNRWLYTAYEVISQP